MTRFLIALLSVALMAYLFQVEAVPLRSRQIGDIQCNVARLKTVSSLAATKSALQEIDTSNSTTTGTAVTAAQSGLDSASAGIKTIAGALLTGQTAPATARDQVKTGLLAAQSALGGITTGDAAVTEAQTKLNDTIAAGSDVVSDCN
ncbi:uncharacterized protein BT62DRAFT_955679 [Guyanagaster necrorhizus]|uniref:Uncharacterized protein n=1 Tax=Guyanagaster necrorhizus TaxID=856835 RepID=A0A9P8AN92_9AGAR|nr:uncharacterized protein BT62DRAFT_955679 [Guyanagaster necrorhizus MCA 3950]KAG7441635.1 hypothetical protein BT62DRAFT_955679 [Guyanagaster necrorhizus MCA 3950]